MKRAYRPEMAAILLAAASMAPVTALAHSEAGLGGGLASGFWHPILGWDHVVAMVAVGLWGAFLGWPAIWLLPVVFPLVMSFGATAGVAGLPLPGVEAGIAGSAVVLGALIMAAARLPIWAAGAVVAIFAIFHGYAHGTELPIAVNPFTFAVGLVVATGLLHLAGIAFGMLVRWPAGRYTIRAGGALISGVGLAFLLGLA